jgi:hypothetical protein
MPADTSREAWDVQNAVYRRMSGAQRLEIALRLSQTARDLARAGIRSRHPDYAEEQVEWALRRLRLGDELMRAAWPDQPLVEP